MKADRTLDCVGLVCPIPIVQTVKMIKELKAGEVLEVIADDRSIIKDMAAWSKSTGNKLLGVEQNGEEIKVYVEKTH